MKALLIGPENPHFLGHLRTLQALPEVTAITLVASDPGDARLLEEARAAHPERVSALSLDVSEALRGDVDFVVACPRNDRAVDVITSALRAGKPVLAEKPAGRTAAETAQIVAVARQAGLPLGVCYQNRLHPAALAARAFVADGLLGELMAVEMRYFTTQLRFRDPKHWLFNKSLSGGGVLHWLGCHYLDLAPYVTGQPIVEARGRIATRSGEAVDVEDVAALSLTFANGASGSLSCGYVLAQSGGGFYNQSGNDTHLAFIGRLGRVWWTPTKSPSTVNFETTHPDWAFAPRRTVTYELPESGAYGGVAGIEFVRRFIQGAPVATGEDALRVAKLLEMVY